MQRYVRVAYWIWWISAIVAVVCAVLIVSLDLRVTRPGVLGPILAALLGLAGLGLMAATFFILGSDLVSSRRSRDD